MKEEDVRMKKLEADLVKEKEEALQEQRRLLEKLEELRAETERLLKEKAEFWDQIEERIKRIPLALQLHLEMDLEYFGEEEMEILRKYGRVNEGISRDFIVPGTMTLHALHYAIMKAFGWQNSHLHSYVPYPDEFQKMTGGKVKEWTRQVGMYFRFPNGDFEDQYWDDDYEEGESVKSWLKGKYCGPYYYDGAGEHYVPAQLEVFAFRREYPAIQKKTTRQSSWGVYFEGSCEEMIERPMIWTVLRTPAEEMDWKAWKAKKDAALKQAEAARKADMKTYEKLVDQMEEVAEKARSLMGKADASTADIALLLRKLEEYDSEMEAFCVEHDPDPIPALSALCYRYDYGDGWEIKITCTNAWYDKSTYGRDEDGNMVRDRNGFVPETALFTDAFGEPVDGEFLEKLKEIARKEKPVCIAWDGMNVLDDVGGVGGFCNFLEKINGNDPEEKKFYKNWARGLGWTGRMSKPENIL